MVGTRFSAALALVAGRLRTTATYAAPAAGRAAKRATAARRLARGLAAAREPDRRAGLLPGLDAGPARRRDRRPSGTRVDSVDERPELPDRLRLAGAAGGSCTSTSAATPAGRDPDLRRRHRRHGRRSNAARCPASADPRGRSARRIAATSTRSTRDADQWHVLYAWQRRHALHGQRARRQAAHLPSGRAEPRPAVAGLVLVEPQALSLRLTRQQLLGGRGGRRLLARRGSTSSSTGSAARRRAPADGAAPPEQHLLHGLRVVEDDGVEVVVPPLHHQLVTARLTVGPSAPSFAQAQAELEDALPAARRAVRADARRARRHGRLGTALLPPLRPGTRGAAPAGRPARHDGEGRPCARSIDAVRFPSDPDDACSRRTTSPSSCAATSCEHVADGARGRLRRARRAARDDEHPKGLRGRRLRRRPEPAEEDGGRCRRARSGPDPGYGGALPRVHLDAEGRARPAADRELRDARATSTSGRRLFPAGHEHARLAHLREPRGVVSQLRLRRARDDDLPPRPEGEAGDADGAAGPG